MLNDFLKEVVIIIVGKQAEDIADLLHSQKHVNEFIIAKKLGITINQTRNILYKISNYGLVSFIRKKDKKKGWYTYFWKIDVIKSLEFLKNVLLKKIEQINYQVKSRETKQFYICERCNVEFNEENALLKDFTCNECGGIFTIKDNNKLLRELKRNLDKFSKKLELVKEEIEKENEKLEKIKLKEAKKIAKNKIVLKIAKKKSVKKPVKKKLLKKKKSVKKPVKKKLLKKKKSVKKPVKKKSVKKITKKNEVVKTTKKLVKKILKRK